MSHADRLERRKMQIVLSMPNQISSVVNSGFYTRARRFVISDKVPIPATSTTLNRLPLPNTWVIDDMDYRPQNGCPPAFPMCSGTQQRQNRVLLPIGTAQFAVDLGIRKPPQPLPYFSDLRSHVPRQKPADCACAITKQTPE